MENCVVCMQNNGNFTKNNCECNYDICDECRKLWTNRNGKFECLYKCEKNKQYGGKFDHLINIEVDQNEFEIFVFRKLNKICDFVCLPFNWILDNNHDGMFIVGLYIVMSLITTLFIIIPAIIINVLIESVKSLNNYKFNDLIDKLNLLINRFNGFIESIFAKL